MWISIKNQHVLYYNITGYISILYSINVILHTYTNIIYIYIYIHIRLVWFDALVEDQIITKAPWCNTIGHIIPSLWWITWVIWLSGLYPRLQNTLWEGTLWLCQNSYWTWQFTVDLPTKNVIFHSFLYVYQRVSEIQLLRSCLGV